MTEVPMKRRDNILPPDHDLCQWIGSLIARDLGSDDKHRWYAAVIPTMYGGKIIVGWFDDPFGYESMW